MNKKSVLWILLELIFLIVFNTVFFVGSGTEHVASVWLSFGFIHFSYIMVLITPLLIRKSSQAALFGLSLYSVSVTYFMVEFLVGILFIILKQDSVKTALIVQVILTGIYLVILIANMIANESTADAVAKHEEEVSYIKNASTSLKMLIGKAESKKANKAIEKVYDLLHSSPAKSNMIVRPIEMNIISRIDCLQTMVMSNDEEAIMAEVKELGILIEQRNAKLKLNQ